jgi:hypothetical protein
MVSAKPDDGFIDATTTAATNARKKRPTITAEPG